MTLQIASGILIAAAILAVVALGVGLAFAALKSQGGKPVFGFLVAAAGLGAAMWVIIAAA